MKKIVAVSGGVDSVVLLHMLVQQAQNEIVVAHFDHGIRSDSASDARFVAGLARMYGLKFESNREELGKNASEELARDHRYEFLRSVADKHNGRIATAHHLDDLVETISINITRGTGWRGLAVFGNQAIDRPLLNYEKSYIYEYAVNHNLEFVEDATNLSKEYLRNRLRDTTMPASSKLKKQLYELWKEQSKIRNDIDSETTNILSKNEALRYLLTMISETEASELLRAWLLKNSSSLTRLQRQRLLHVIKTARVGTIHEVGDNTRLEFTSNSFVVKQ